MQQFVSVSQLFWVQCRHKCSTVLLTTIKCYLLENVTLLCFHLVLCNFLFSFMSDRQEHWSSSTASKDRSSLNGYAFVLVENEQEKTERLILFCVMCLAHQSQSLCTNKCYPTVPAVSLKNVPASLKFPKMAHSPVEWIKPFFFLFLLLTGMKYVIFPVRRAYIVRLQKCSTYSRRWSSVSGHNYIDKINKAT